MYFDGDHWVIANSPEEADAVLAEMKHPPKSDFPGLQFHPWQEIPDNQNIGPIHYEELEVAGLEIVGRLTGPASAWVAVLKRGLLGSRECCNDY